MNIIIGIIINVLTLDNRYSRSQCFFEILSNNLALFKLNEHWMKKKKQLIQPNKEIKYNWPLSQVLLSFYASHKY
jgi:hypothetical protein